MLSRDGAITGRVLDALRHRRARQRGGGGPAPAGPATVEITSEPGGIHAWLACATRN
jgi:hypothetical protein